MFQINAGRGAHLPARQTAALVCRPIICFVNGSIARSPWEDGAYHASWGWLSVTYGLGCWRRASPSSHCCSGAPGEMKHSPTTSTHEWEKQRVVLLIACNNCHRQGARMGQVGNDTSAEHPPHRDAWDSPGQWHTFVFIVFQAFNTSLSIRCHLGSFTPTIPQAFWSDGSHWETLIGFYPK